MLQLLKQNIKKNLLSYAIALSILIHLAGFYFFAPWQMQTEQPIEEWEVVKIKNIIIEPKNKEDPVEVREEKEYLEETRAPEISDKVVNGSPPRKTKPVNPAVMAKAISAPSPSLSLNQIPIPLERSQELLMPLKPTEIVQGPNFRETPKSSPSIHARPQSSLSSKTFLGPASEIARVEFSSGSFAPSPVSSHNSNGGTVPISLVSAVSSFISTEDSLSRQSSEKIFAHSFDRSAAHSFEDTVSVQSVPRIQQTVPSPYSGPLKMTALPLGDREKESSSQNPDQEKNGSEISHHAKKLGELQNGYSKQVWAKIAAAIHYPRIARKRGYEGKPVVSFILRQDGELAKLTIIKPSLYTTLDRAALEAVRRAVPYPPFPKLLNRSSIRFQLPISYILDKP